jgi:hypothetical protein
MGLDQYCFDKRPLTLAADATAYEALCALERNHVGAVMVEEYGRLVGIVTDRDLALRVCGARPCRLQQASIGANRLLCVHRERRSRRRDRVDPHSSLSANSLRWHASGLAERGSQ